MIKSLKKFSNKYFYHSLKNFVKFEKDSNSNLLNNFKLNGLSDPIDIKKINQKKKISKYFKSNFKSINLVLSNNNQFNIHQDLSKKKSLNFKTNNIYVSKILTKQLIAHLSLNSFENCKTNTVIVTVINSNFRKKSI